MGSKACFPARIHRNVEVPLTKEHSLTEGKMTMREEAELRLAKWKGYDERLQRLIMSFNDYSTVTV